MVPGGEKQSYVYAAYIFHLFLTFFVEDKHIYFLIAAQHYNLTENLTSLLTRVRRAKHKFEHVIFMMDPLVLKTSPHK